MKLFALALSLAFVVLMASSSRVDAEVISFSFTGDVTSVDADLLGTFSTSDTINGSVSFESTTIDSFGGDPTVGRYSNLLNLQFQVGGYSSNTSGGGMIQVQNAISLDEYLINHQSFSGLTVNGAAPTVFNIGLVDTSAMAFTTDTLPLVPPTLGSFDSFTNLIRFENNGGKDVRFDLTSFELSTPAVPEPSSIVLLGIGVAGLLIRNRRRYSK